MPYGMYRSPIAHGTPSQRRQEDALVLVNEHEERWWEGELYRLKGELLLLAASAVRDTAHTPEACFWQALDLISPDSPHVVSNACAFPPLSGAVSTKEHGESQGLRATARTAGQGISSWPFCSNCLAPSRRAW
jgi:hypothetical protein